MVPTVDSSQVSPPCVLESEVLPYAAPRAVGNNLSFIASFGSDVIAVVVGLEAEVSADLSLSRAEDYLRWTAGEKRRGPFDVLEVLFGQDHLRLKHTIGRCNDRPLIHHCVGLCL